MQLYNEAGLLLASYNLITQNEHDQYSIPGISLLKNGIYFLVIKEKEGAQLAVQKFIKK